MRTRKDPLTVVAALFVAVISWRNIVGFQGKDYLSGWLVQDPYSASAEAVTQPRLKLKVPFYVYEDEMNWSAATFDGRPLNETVFSIPGYKKHSDDYWLLLAALKHPLRTYDAREAKLFFVPTLLNALSIISYTGDSRKLCIRPRKCLGKGRKKWESLSFADDLLGRSQYFQNSNGTDHVIVASHFTSRIFADQPNIQRCHQFIFENKVTGSVLGVAEPEDANMTTVRRLRIPSLYIGNPCTYSSKKTHDFALIAQMLEDDQTNHRYPLFQSRRDICKWLKQGNFSTSHCGSGVKQCPHLSNARYGFHVRGDSWGSNRLMDTLQSGTVPLFTNEEQYKILPDILPWRKLSYFVNVTSFEAFQESLHSLLDLPESDYEEKLRLIEEYQPILDPTKIYQFDHLMASLAAQIGLQ